MTATTAAAAAAQYLMCTVVHNAILRARSPLEYEILAVLIRLQVDHERLNSNSDDGSCR